MKAVKPNGLNEGKRTAVILAGGLSRRFGSDKVFAKWEGRFLLEILTQSLTEKKFEVLISLAELKPLPVRGLKTFIDPLPFEGPLQALYGALFQLESSHCLLVACDMPFLQPEVIEELWEAGTSADVAVLKYQSQIHPLPGVYAKRILPQIEQCIAQKRRDLKSLLTAGLHVHLLEGRFPSVRNINTPGDFA